MSPGKNSGALGDWAPVKFFPCVKYMCLGFAWSECMNYKIYLLECNAKLYVLVTVWKMIVYV